jgi:hypothetical protein
VPEKLHSTNHLALGKEPVYGSDGHIWKDMYTYIGLFPFRSY